MRLSEKIDHWQKSIGISLNGNVEFNCDAVLNIMQGDIAQQDIEAIIFKLSSYNFFLKSQKADIEAKLELINNFLSRELYTQTANLGDEFQYKTHNEKIAIVRKANPKINRAINRKTLLSAKLNKIKDIPYTIDIFIDVLKMRHRRIDAQIK